MPSPSIDMHSCPAGACAGSELLARGYYAGIAEAWPETGWSSFLRIAVAA